MFPRGRHGKNGADIRMAIDVIEDLNLNPHLTTIVIVGGDSDYISIAQRVRQKGRTIVGIGVRETTNQYWIKACSEFKFYAGLLTRATGAAGLDGQDYESDSLDEAKELLVKAVRVVMQTTGENFALKAAVKPMMVRLDGSFDEANYGFSSFSAMLDACRDVVALSAGQYDQLVMLRDDAAPPVEPTDGPLEFHPYVRTLRLQKVRLVPPSTLEKVFEATWAVYGPDAEGAPLNAYRTLVTEWLSAAQQTIPESDINKVRGLLYKAFCFLLDGEADRVRLDPSIGSLSELRLRVLRNLVGRVLDQDAQTEESFDCEAMSQLLWGDTAHTDEVAAAVEYCRGDQAGLHASRDSLGVADETSEEAG